MTDDTIAMLNLNIARVIVHSISHRSHRHGLFESSFGAVPIGRFGGTFPVNWPSQWHILPIV